MWHRVYALCHILFPKVQVIFLRGILSLPFRGSRSIPERSVGRLGWGLVSY